MKIKQEIKALFRLSVPIIIGNLSQVGMGFTDVMMAGRLGAQELAAVAMGSSLWVLVFLFIMGTFVAVSPIVAQYTGANKSSEIAPVFQHALWLVVVLAIPSVVMVNGASIIMTWLSIDQVLIQVTEDYLNAFSWGMPSIALFLALRFTSEGLGHTRPMMVIQFAGVFVNVLGNYIFMYGHAGMPAMGATGAGVSSAIVLWLNSLALLYYIKTAGFYRPYNLFSQFIIPCRKYFLEIIKTGVPIAMILLIEVGMFSSISLLVGKLGAVNAAAHQVAINFASFTFMIPLGFGRAATVRVGNAIGANNIAAARFTGLVAALMSVFVMLFTAGFMLAFPELIVAVYTHDQAVALIAVQLLMVAGLFQVFDGLQVAVNGALQGMKDTLQPMIITFIAYWLIGLPVGYELGISYGFGAKGLWWGFIFGLAVAAILLSLRFRKLTCRQVNKHK